MTQNTFHGKIDRNVVTIGRKNMGKKTDKSTVGLILGFVKRMQEDHIGAYAAQAAYFLIMSFIPFVLVLTALVQYTPLTYRMLRQAILGFVPLNLRSLQKYLPKALQLYRFPDCLHCGHREKACSH